MKITRKGFTLVELLIVVAILGTLSASMMVSFGSSTAAAKASSIAANVSACMSAANAYYNENLNTITADTTTDDIKAKITNWDKIASGGAIVYTLSGAGSDNWVIQVNFSTATDKEKTAIATALKKIQGYNATADSGTIDSGNFKVNLLTGEITAGA